MNIKILLLTFSLLALCGASDGQLGTTSQATCNVSLTIPAKMENPRLDSKTGQVIVDTNVDLSEMDTRTVLDDKKKGIKVVIFEPKLD